MLAGSVRGTCGRSCHAGGKIGNGAQGAPASALQPLPRAQMAWSCGVWQSHHPGLDLLRGLLLQVVYDYADSLPTLNSLKYSLATAFPRR